MAKQPQSCAFRTSIGGQALIEGILMRGPEKQAIVVRDRRQSGGEGGGAAAHQGPASHFGLAPDPRHRQLPLLHGQRREGADVLRGLLSGGGDHGASKFEQWLDRTFSNKKLEGLIVGLSVLLGIGLSIFLFLVLPTFLTGGCCTSSRTSPCGAGT